MTKNAFAGFRAKTRSKTIHLEEADEDITIHALTKGNLDEVIDVVVSPGVLNKLKLGADTRAVMIGAAMKAFDRIAMMSTRSEGEEALADVRAIAPDDAMDLLGEVIELTFPKGLTSFFDKLTKRLEHAGISSVPAAGQETTTIPAALAATPLSEADPSQAGVKMSLTDWATATPAPTSDGSAS